MPEPDHLIFVNYRGVDELWVMEFVYRRMIEAFGEETVFRAGDEFSPLLLEEAAHCPIMLVCVGPAQLKTLRSDDWLRREIAVALRAGNRVIPLLLGDWNTVAAPDPSQLPPDVADFAGLQFRRLIPGAGLPLFMLRLIEDLVDLVPALRARRRSSTPTGTGATAAAAAGQVHIQFTDGTVFVGDHAHNRISGGTDDRPEVRGRRDFPLRGTFIPPDTDEEVWPRATVDLGSAQPPRASDHDPPADEDRHRHLVAQASAAVAVAVEFSVVLRIVAKAPAPSSGVAAAAFVLPDAEPTTRVTVIAHSTPGLIPLDGLERDIEVPRRGDSAPARLPFRPRTEGLHQIHLTAWIGGSFLCELSVEVSVDARAGRSVGAAVASAPLGPLRARAGEVTLQIAGSGGNLSFQLISDDFLGGFVRLESRVREPDAAVERVINTLRLLAKGKAPYQASAARRWMQEAGVGLWRQMVPEAVRYQFWELRDRIGIFNIATDDSIPWELLYPLDDGHDEGFLIEGFPVLRRVRGQGRSAALRLERPKFVVSSSRPSTAGDEFAAIQRIVGPGEVIERFEDLMAAIDAGELGMAHFACHNAFDPAAGSSIDMVGGPFAPDLLNSAAAKRSLVRSSPLVFLNACRSLGTAPEYTEMIGWAQKFLAAGAGAFVGTLWAVRSETATSFATAFYTALAEGQPLGRAVLAARRAAAAGDSDPTWLAYSAYGDPAATLLSHPQGET